MIWSHPDCANVFDFAMEVRKYKRGLCVTSENFQSRQLSSTTAKTKVCYLFTVSSNHHKYNSNAFSQKMTSVSPKFPAVRLDLQEEYNTDETFLLFNLHQILLQW